MKLLVPEPHPLAEIVTAQSTRIKPDILKYFGLVLHLFEGDFIGGFFEVLLTGNDVVGEHAAGSDDLGKVLAEIVDVKGDFFFGGFILLVV